MKSKIQELNLTGTPTEMLILSKQKTLLKCSILLFGLSLCMCLLEDLDLNQLYQQLIAF